MYNICSLHKNICIIVLTGIYPNISLGSLYIEKKINLKVKFCIMTIYVILNRRRKKNSKYYLDVLF